MDALILQKCEISLGKDSFCIYAPDREVAATLRKACQWTAQQALSLGLNRAEIHYPGCKKPWSVPAKMALNSSNESPSMSEEIRLNLLGADYLRILECLIEWRQEGRIVCITSNTTNICLHTNDLLKPSRAYWNASQFTGYNYLKSWRLNRDEDPDSPQRLNPQYATLRSLLDKDGYVPGYEYTLFRPDGARCSYSTDYFLCNDYCGDQVRIGVSRVEDWRLLETAPVG